MANLCQTQNKATHVATFRGCICYEFCKLYLLIVILILIRKHYIFCFLMQGLLLYVNFCVVLVHAILCCFGVIKTNSVLSAADRAATGFYNNSNNNNN